MTSKPDLQSFWTVYMVRCRDNSLYTGITNDLDRRISQHNGNSGVGARYTRSRRPVTLVYSEIAADRASASRREAALKSLHKSAKEKLVGG